MNFLKSFRAAFCAWSVFSISALESPISISPRRPLPAPGAALAGTNAPQRAETALPPLPDGVAELKFEDFFKRPVGPRGAEFTAQLRALEGKRVRILGFMVREEVEREPKGDTEMEPPAGRFLLAPMPMTVSPGHYGLCDDLPPQTLFVHVPQFDGQRFSFRPGRMLLTGVLTLGNQLEADGRTSSVRLKLDPIAQ